MSKEDMVKEAVEEAKAKAAEAQKAEADKEDTAEENPQKTKQLKTDSRLMQRRRFRKGAAGGSRIGCRRPGSKAEKRSFLEKRTRKTKKTRRLKSLPTSLTRQMAEFDNFRKRTEKEKSQMYEMGAKDIIEKILPVVDNFERGLASVPEEEKADPFAEGMEKIYKQLMTTLEGIGVKPIEAVGKEFDPNFHNAVMHVEDEKLGENIVAEEFQKGYTYRDSVVRHSMVKVAN